jgi:integrase/recombinase XerC
LRDHAILELFYSSGLRLSELVNLKIEDINFSDEIISVLGKGKKMRIVPIGKEAIQALRKWIKSRSQLNNVANNSVLFLTKQTKELTQRAVQYRLKFWAKKQGISENIHPHLLRHSFASHLLQSSQDLRAVQELLGHENISSTQIYTHLDFQHLAKTYDQAHPRAKKNKK